MSKQLSEEARKARNAYYREWRKKNPEKVKQANEKFWKKKAKEMQEQAEQEAEGGEQAKVYLHREVDLNDETIN